MSCWFIVQNVSPQQTNTSGSKGMSLHVKFVVFSLLFGLIKTIYFLHRFSKRLPYYLQLPVRTIEPFRNHCKR